MNKIKRIGMVAVLTLALSLGAGVGSASMATLTFSDTAVTGSAALTLTGAAGSAITIGAAAQTGTVSVGASTGDMQLDIGTGIGAHTINIGTGGTGVNAITIGGNTGTVAIDSGDWDISATGVMTGIGAITTDGNITFAANAIDGTYFDVAATTGAVTLTQQAVGTAPLTITGIDSSTSAIIDLNATADGGSVIDVDWVAATQTAAVAGIDVDMTNLTADGTNVIYGVHVNDHAAAAAGVEYGIYVEGTEWDQGLYVVDAVKFDGAVTIAAGNLTDASVVEDDLAASLAFDDADLVSFASVSVDSATEGLIFPQHATDCSALGTAEGQVCWQADTDTLYIGDGATVTQAIGNVSSANTWTDNQIYTLAGDEDIAITSAPVDGAAINAVSLTLTALDTGGATTAQYGLYIDNAASSEGADALIALNNADTDTAVTDGLLIASAAGAITDAIDVSDAEIVNAINIGVNAIVGTQFAVAHTTGAVTLTQQATGTIPLLITGLDDGTAAHIDINTHNVGGSIIDIDWTTETQTAAIAGIDVDMTNLTADGATTLYGVHVNDQVGATAATEYGIYVEGTNWDQGLYVADTSHLAGLVTLAAGIDVTATGITLSNDETITNAGDGVVVITSDEVTGCGLTIIGADHNTTSDAILTLDADAGGDNADTWILESEADGNNFTVNNHDTEKLSLTTAGNLTITGNLKTGASGIVQFVYYDADVADLEEYELTVADGKAGWGYASCGVEDAHFRFTTAGVVTLLTKSTNVGSTDDVDAKFNIFDAGTTIKFENQLGAGAILTVEVYYVD